ncbi:MAG: S24/S26 family peptidase [Acidimicrobiia bacterium]
MRAKAAVLRRRASAGTMWFRVDGVSMGRSIPWGSEVLVVPAERPRVGEVWAFCTANGELVVHRHRRPIRGAYVFQGDAKASPDDPVRADQLIGRVVAVRAGGQVRRLGAGDRITGWTMKTARLARARMLETLWRTGARGAEPRDSLV